MPGRLRAALVAFAVSCALCSPSTSFAAPAVEVEAGEPHMAVLVDGPDAARIGMLIELILPRNVVVEDAARFRKLLAKKGLKDAPGGHLGDVVSRTTLLVPLRAAMQAQDLGWAIVARAAYKGARRSVRLILVERDGKIIHEDELELGAERSAREDRDQLEGALAWVLAPFGPPAPHDDERLAAAEGLGEAAQPDERPRARASGRVLAEIGLAVGIAGRFVEWVDPITDNLLTYRLEAVPTIGVDAEVFPMARTGWKIAQDLGVVGSFGAAVGLSAQRREGAAAALSARWLWGDLGLRYRLRLRDPIPELGVSLRWAANEFAITGDPVTVAVSPAVEYHEVRVGLDARAEIGRVRILVDGAYRQPLATGVLDQRFPRRSVGAIDVGLGVRVRAYRELAIGARAEYVRYFYDLKPQPGDAYVAGGALDQQYRVRLDVSWRFR